MCENDFFKKYIERQKDEILKYKWIRSEEEGKDVGNQIAHEWISKYAKHFRNVWLCDTKCDHKCTIECPVNVVLNDINDKDHEYIFIKDKNTRENCELLLKITNEFEKKKD